MCGFIDTPYVCLHPSWLTSNPPRKEGLKAPSPTIQSPKEKCSSSLEDPEVESGSGWMMAIGGVVREEGGGSLVATGRIGVAADQIGGKCLFKCRVK